MVTASLWMPRTTFTSRGGPRRLIFQCVTLVQSVFGGSGPLGVGDAFVVKLNAAGTSLLYSTYLGGDQDDFGEGIAVDADGSAYVRGLTTSTNYPTTANAFQTSFKGQSDAFVSKLDSKRRVDLLDVSWWQRRG